MSQRFAESGIERVEFSVHTADEVADVVSQFYVGHRPRLGSLGPDASFKLVTSSLPQLGADVLDARMTYETATDPFPSPVSMVVLRGTVRIATGRESVNFAPGQSWLYRTGLPADIFWKDLSGVLIRASAHDLLLAARELTGLPDLDLRFHSIVPASRALGRYWREVAMLVAREMSSADSAVASPLVADQLRRLVAAGLLAVFPNTTMTMGHLPGPGHAAPASVRRAVAFIEDNCDRPLTVSEVAEAAGTGTRALQAAFARHHGMSPMAYLRRVRLEQAHRALQTTDPTTGTTVEQVARQWGFANPGRFAAEYRAVFGRYPRETLRG
jgi:AraC-like DNA-binding protein